MTVGIGVDVGGTSIRAARISASGEVEASVKREVGARDPRAVIEQVLGAAREVGAAAGAHGPPLAVGLAAQLRLKSGVVAVAPNFGWTDVPFAALISETFGRRVRLVNDLNAIAFGEARVGAGRGSKHVACVFVGTGLGMGAVVEGTLMEGADGLATELGHTKVDSVETGRRCGCGQRGCLEAYTSGRHLPELFAARVAAGTPSRLFDSVRGDLSKLDARSIEEAATQGDAAALELWEEIARLLGNAVGSVITLFNPEVLILGGGVLLTAPSLEDRVEQQVRAFASTPQLEEVELREAALGDMAGAIGAGLLAQG